MKIIVTGGCGYIGSHTIVSLISQGYDVISIDDLSNSFAETFQGIEAITSNQIRNHQIDLCNWEDTASVFEKEGKIDGVIHFAAKKYVNESVAQPLEYYENNINSLVNVLRCCEKFDIQHFVFSSSCSVYGNVKQLPVDETSELSSPESPYAHTKLIGESIIKDFLKTYNFKATLLRYFNPIGTHESGQIGESAKQASPNLMPRIMGTAKGEYEVFEIAGSDYPTKDGTCVRDYIHVMDIANAHTKALEWLVNEHTETVCEVFNLGSGDGVSVLEMVKSFEKANDLSLNFKLGPRRSGDVVAIYADNSKARKLLNWQIEYSLEDMMKSAWEWEKKQPK